MSIIITLFFIYLIIVSIATLAGTLIKSYIQSWMKKNHLKFRWSKR